MTFRIYYLDDEPDLCENMAYALSSTEVTVETFLDAEFLISRCEEVKPDLVFIDYRLPGTTGDEVAQKLDPAIPKVLITGEFHVQTTYQFIVVLKKPVYKKELLALIAQVKKMAEKGLESI